MLQFATCESSRYGIAEEVGMALEGGCKWIRLTGSPDREMVKSLMPGCESAGAILVLDDNADLVDELRIHGLHLTSWTRGEAIAAREKLGPHAIVGVTCQTACQALELKGLDIDYMVVPAPADADPLELYAGFCKEMREAEIAVHPVASGNFPIVMLPSVIASGMAGVELSAEVLEAEDPAGFVRTALAALGR